MDIQFSQLFQLLSDDTRLRSLMLMKQERELSVCELVHALGEIQPKVSRHLAALRDYGVVIDRRSGQWIYYQIDPDLPAWARQVIEAIREMPATEQSLIVGRLVSEISTARTIEKALFARRLLLSGRQVPEVYATAIAREHADTSIAELDREIDNLLFETRVRREVVSDTVVTLLQRAAARRQASLSVPSVPTIDPQPLKNGRVEQ